MNFCKRVIPDFVQFSVIVSHAPQFVREKVIEKDTINFKVSIKDVRFVDDSFEVRDFSIGSIQAAGAVNLLKPVGTIPLGFDVIEDVVSRVSE